MRRRSESLPHQRRAPRRPVAAGSIVPRPTPNVGGSADAPPPTPPTRTGAGPPPDACVHRAAAASRLLKHHQRGDDRRDRGHVEHERDDEGHQCVATARSGSHFRQDHRGPGSIRDGRGGSRGEFAYGVVGAVGPSASERQQKTRGPGLRPEPLASGAGERSHESLVSAKFSAFATRSSASGREVARLQVVRGRVHRLPRERSRARVLGGRGVSAWGAARGQRPPPTQRRRARGPP